jgi:dihydropteroate synthase
VRDYLKAGARRLLDAGVSADRIVLDPGFGFGKTVAHNYTLLRELAAVAEPGYACLVGISRKSMIGAVTGRPAGQRLGGSIAAALAAVTRGAHIVRVHDVAETVSALKVWFEIERGARA